MTGTSVASRMRIAAHHNATGSSRFQLRQTGMRPRVVLPGSEPGPHLTVSRVSGRAFLLGLNGLGEACRCAGPEQLIPASLGALLREMDCVAPPRVNPLQPIQVPAAEPDEVADGTATLDSAAGWGEPRSPVLACFKALQHQFGRCCTRPCLVRRSATGLPDGVTLTPEFDFCRFQ